MKKWKVEIPVVGYISMIIEADNENDAIQNGIKEANKSIINSDIADYVEALDSYENLIDGNFCYFQQTKATAECIEDDIY